MFHFTYDTSQELCCDICNRTKVSYKFKFGQIPRSIYTKKDFIALDFKGPFQIGSLRPKYMLTISWHIHRMLYACIVPKRKFVLRYVRRCLARWNMTPAVMAIDGALEFKKGDLRKFCDDIRCHVTASPPYCSQLNGEPERAHRKIFDRAVCMMLENGVPTKFFSYAIEYATYLLNRSYHSGVNGIPEELRLGRQLDLSDIVPFGRVVYFKKHKLVVTGAPEGEINPGSETGICLGVDQNSSFGTIIVGTRKSVVLTRHFRLSASKTFKDLTSDVMKPTPIFTNDIAHEMILRIDSPPQSTISPAADSASSAASVEEQVLITTDTVDTQDMDELESQADESNDVDITDQASGDKPVPRAVAALAAFNQPTQSATPMPRPRPSYVDMDILTDEDTDINCVLTDEFYEIRERARLIYHLYDDEEDSDINNVNDEHSEYDVTRRIDREIEHPVIVPRSFKHLQSMKNSPWYDKWLNAYKAELAALVNNNTFEGYTGRTPSKPLHTIVIFTLKPSRFKARLCVLGNLEKDSSGKYKIPDIQTYAATIRGDTIRLLIACAAHQRKRIRTVDISNAFLHSPAHRNIYIRLPDGLDLIDHGLGDLNNLTSLRLCKMLYGLVDAPFAWFVNLGTTIQSKLTRCPYDPALYSNVDVYAGCFVDDIFIVGDETAANDLVDLLQSKYKKITSSDTDKCISFCGLKIYTSNQGYFLTQHHYISQVYKDYHDGTPRRPSSPLPSDSQLSEPISGGQQDPTHASLPYRELLMSLMYVALHTRFDILHACVVLARYSHQYTDHHFALVQRLLAYTYHTRNKGILYRFNSDDSTSGVHFHVDDPTKPRTASQIESDASFNVKTLGRKSVGGYVAWYRGSPVGWTSNILKFVTYSTSESELKQLSITMNYGLWFSRMLSTLGLSTRQDGTLPLWCDNQVAIRTMQRPSGSSRKLAHVDKYWFYTQQYLKRASNDLCTDPELERFDLQHRSGKNLVADIMTKPLGGPHHAYLSKLGGLVDPPADILVFFE